MQEDESSTFNPQKESGETDGESALGADCLVEILRISSVKWELEFGYGV
jgi:hypothetical protein